MTEAKWYEGLSPLDVFTWFDRISQIPRGSGNLAEISDAVVSWIRDMGLRAEKDEYCNIKAFKPASPGYEDAPAVMLASHLDMVCAKTDDSDHDFLKDPIDIQLLDGDIITADRTSLGADDGMGMAMVLSILADRELPHPALEAVFTAEEETDMSGALSMDYSDLRSELIISLDGDPVSIAGAGELDTIERFGYETEAPKEGSAFFKVVISGLQGGHSGMEATRERGNAVMLLNRFLDTLRKETDLQIATLKGGNISSTAFAYYAEAVIAVPAQAEPTVREAAAAMQAVYREDLKHRDEGITLTAAPAAYDGDVVTQEDTDKLITFLLLLPDGVMSRNFDFPGLMESSINTGVVFMEEGAFVIKSTIRSATASKKEYIFEKVRALCGVMDVAVEIENDLPQWDMRVSDEILELCKKIYPDCGITVDEATGECGIFTQKMPHASAISLQCPYEGAHSIEEKISASLVKVYFERLKTFLAALQ